MKKKIKGWYLGPLLLLVFAWWHSCEVQSAVVETGDGWLTGGYWGVALAVLALSLMAGWLLFSEGRSASRSRSVSGNCSVSESRRASRDRSASESRSVSGNHFRLERIYPVLGLILGVLYLFVLSPLSAPDEISHYVSAYQLSGRLLGQPSTAPNGRALIRGQDIWVEDMEGIYEYETDEAGYLQVITETADPENGAEQTEQANYVLGMTLDESTYEVFYELGLNGQYAPERSAELEGKWIGSQYPPVNTTPLAYLPQAVGISIGRLLHTTTVPLLILGRFFNLLFFVGMTTLAMRRLPFGKEVLFGVVLLPMTLHLSASFSYDVMILGCMFYFGAVCLDLAYRKEKVGIGDVVLLAVLMAVAGPCKMIYAVLMGLCLLIPVKKFGGWGRWAAAAALVAGAFAVSMYLVNHQVVASYVSETSSYVQWAGEPGYSLTYLLHNPKKLVKMIYQTCLWQAKELHLGMIGASLGNLDPVLDVPYLAVMAFTVCLLELAFRKPGENLEIAFGGRIWIWVLCLGCVLGALVSMLIAWTPMGAMVIAGVQGRYFLPFLPMLLISLKNNTVVLTKDRNRSILYLMCCLNGYGLLRLFATVSMRL